MARPRLMTDDLHYLTKEAQLRVHASRAMNVLRLASDSDAAYRLLASLLGYSSKDAYMRHLLPQHHHILEAIAGPNGYAIYKALEAKRGKQPV